MFSLPTEKSCVYGDVEYQSGDTFLNPINACEECRCKDKKVTCKGRECPGQGNCQHPYDGECCPVCDGEYTSGPINNKYKIMV